MKAYFVPSIPSFISENWRKDGTYTEDSWPSDAVLVSEEEAETYWMTAPPEGKQLGVIKGKPAWIDIPPPSQDELIMAAERKREFLLREAQETISFWQTELQLGIISDEDKASLIAWMNYIKAVQAVDTSKAPDITWPTPPTA
ncbi:tail fiber assembly protein [Enterobacter roggenkampii]|uniref:tail fiber assembly protein n=1 Tax=Enterobacter roggenkampii TaxID=1812935 RepID=UPI001F49B90B|nr:tail fiber assembly protein [Enterobacter roggenkampii]